MSVPQRKQRRLARGWGDKVKGNIAIEPCGLTGLESGSKCKSPFLGKRVLGDAVTEQKELLIEGRLCVSIPSRDETRRDGRWERGGGALTMMSTERQKSKWW